MILTDTIRRGMLSTHKPSHKSRPADSRFQALIASFGPLDQRLEFGAGVGTTMRFYVADLWSQILQRSAYVLGFHS